MIVSVKNGEAQGLAAYLMEVLLLMRMNKPMEIMKFIRNDVII